MPRARKPRAKKEMAGTVKEIREIEPPKPSGSMPDPPPRLSDEARALWDEYGPLLNQCGVLTSVDGPLFAMWCELTAEYQLAQSFLSGGTGLTRYREEGSRGQTVVDPIVKIRDSAFDRATRLGARFGLDPVGRMSLDVKPRDENADDPTERLLRLAR